MLHPLWQTTQSYSCTVVTPWTFKFLLSLKTIVTDQTLLLFHYQILIKKGRGAWIAHKNASCNGPQCVGVSSSSTFLQCLHTGHFLYTPSSFLRKQNAWHKINKTASAIFTESENMIHLRFISVKLYFSSLTSYLLSGRRTFSTQGFGKISGLWEQADVYLKLQFKLYIPLQVYKGRVQDRTPSLQSICMK